MALANSCQSMLTNIYKSFPSPTIVSGPRIIHIPFLSYWYDILNPLYLHKRNIIEFKLHTNCLHLLATGLRDPKLRLKSTEWIFSVFPLANINLVGKHLKTPQFWKRLLTHTDHSASKGNNNCILHLSSAPFLWVGIGVLTLCIWALELASIPLNSYLYH